MVDEETREKIVEIAEGNALYAEQLASFAADGGDGLPPTLEAVLAGRLGRLDPAERSVLQRAAVVGREFSLGAVAALADGEVAPELLSLSRAGFVHPAAAADPGDDGYTFHHVLLRDAAYGSLTKADRADLHERAADWIDRDGPGDDAIAGYHLEQAVRYRRELGEDADELAARAGERLGEAGMRAWRSGDVGATVALLGRAVALLPAGERRGELQLECGLALRLRDRAAEADEAWASAQRDAATARSSRLQARVACERAQSALLAGDLPLDGAAGVLAEALPKLRAAGDVRGLARAELFLSNVHWFACRYDDFAAAAARAEQYYTESGFSPALPLAIQAEALYYGAVPVGEALRICAELQERTGDSSARATTTAVLGALRAVEGGIEDGQLLLAHARSLYEEIGNEQGVLMTWSPLFVEVEALAGNRDVAKAHFRASIDRLRSTTHSVAHASTQAALLAHLLLDGGETDEADMYARLAENEALSSDVLVQFLWRSARARVLGRAGQTAEAEEIARDAVRIASLTDGFRDRARAHFALAEVMHLGGKAKEARAEATVGRRLLRQKGATALLQRHRTPTPAPG